MTAEGILGLAREYLGEEPQLTALHQSGGHRRYFRAQVHGRSVIAVAGTDADENKAFISLAAHFAGKGINVPCVLAVSGDGLSYLLEDLGDMSLFDVLASGRTSGLYGYAERKLLEMTVSALPKIQVEGAQGLDWSVCSPLQEFDARTVDFDLNYFKYCFLKNTGVEFDEVRLQDDFDRLKAVLLAEPCETFMYRDFQARNVMLRDGEPWFIDFQGGRKGPVHYDVASFLWQARAKYPAELREHLIDTYIDALRYYREVDADEFREQLRHFVLFRCLQTLGAYGFRGLVEHKPHFVASIVPAVEQLGSLLPTGYPYIDSIVSRLLSIYRAPEVQKDCLLTVEVQSFSYRKGYPEDNSGNGGGFVFDCRGIHNPGRYDDYRSLTGRDRAVIDFLETDSEMPQFMCAAYQMVDPHVETFIRRGFTSLQVSFGCTGGQHRSVYGAEHMAAHIRDKYPGVRVVLRHIAQGIETVL